MIGRVTVEVPTNTYTALLQQLRQSGSPADPAQALTAAVELWVAEQRRLAGVAPSFTLAAVLRRRALAGNSGPDAPAAPTLEGSALTLSQAAVQQLAVALATALAKLAPPRSTEAGPRWDLPERRQFRYRAEDLSAD